MDRRRLELEADRAAGGHVDEMIRVDGLRRPGEAFDRRRHQRGGNDGRMQERAQADRGVRIGEFASHQQRGRADRARGADENARANPDAPRGGRGAVDIHRRAFERLDALAGAREAQRPGAGHERRAARERVRDRRHQHRLLRVGRAADAAIAEVQAALHVAPNRAPADREPRRAFGQCRVVRVRRDGPRRDAEPRLDALEPWREIGGAEAREPVHRRPLRERRLRRAKRARPVDRRAPAHAAPLQDVDRLVGGLARGRFLVQVPIRVRLAHPEVRRGLERSLLDHDDAQPGVGQRFGRDPAARPGADDRDVSLESDVVLEARRVDDVPAAGDPFANRIREPRDGGGLRACTVLPRLRLARLRCLPRGRTRAHERSGGPG